MLVHPKLKDCYKLELLDDETCFLLWETGHRVLKGRLYCLVLPLADGTRTSEDIVDQLENQAPLAQIYYTLMVLEQSGYIAEYQPDIPKEIAAFWQAEGIDLSHLKKTLAERGINVVSMGAGKPEPFREALRDLGLEERNDNLTVYLVDDFLDHRLAEVNRQALESGEKWALVKPIGTMVWIGPVFSPQSACWQCLATRLEDNRLIESFLMHQRHSDKPINTSFAALPATVDACYQLAALELARWLIGSSQEENTSRIQNKLLTIDWLKMETREHVLVKRAQCPACGCDAYRNGLEPEPVHLQDGHKVFTTNGGHRILTAEETYERYKHHVSPITGVVRHLEVIKTANDGPIHNIDAGPNLAIRNPTMDLLESRFRSSSLGKGKTLFQARASGLCEAIERYSGGWQGYEAAKSASFEEMGAAAIHPNECMLYSEEQYNNREQLNKETLSNFFKIPVQFNPKTRISWSPLWSITKQQFRWLPTQFCYYAYPEEENRRFCFADSNGCASGNNVEEAVLQGLLELVERDAVAVWWYNRLNYPKVNLESFSDAYIEELLDYYEHKLEREVWALDLTNDLGVPAFVALSRSLKGNEEILMGFGAHLVPKVGLVRAITEMNQMSALLGPRDKVKNDEDYTSNPLINSWFQDATIANQPYLLPDNDSPESTPEDHSTGYNEDLRDDILYLVNMLKDRGLETLVLNQTRPDIGLSTVKMVVPGLRHFWSRYGKGRLYDVPVAMGKLERPLTEEELNPIAMFL